MVFCTFYKEGDDAAGEVITILDKDAPINMHPYKENINPAYNKFPVIEGPEDDCPFATDEDNQIIFWGVVKVKDFVDWYDTYTPHISAGWFSRYDEWLLKKGLLENPEKHSYIVPLNPSTDVFTEFEILSAPETPLYDYIYKNYGLEDFSKLSLIYAIAERKEENA